MIYEVIKIISTLKVWFISNISIEIHQQSITHEECILPHGGWFPCFSAGFRVLHIKQCLSAVMYYEIHSVKTFHCYSFVLTCHVFINSISSFSRWKVLKRQLGFRHTETHFIWNNGSPLWTPRYPKQWVCSVSCSVLFDTICQLLVLQRILVSESDNVHSCLISFVCKFL